MIRREEKKERRRKKEKKERRGRLMIVINTEIGDFIFHPTFVVKDKLEKPLLYLRFNRKEKLVIYHTTEHVESKNAADKFKTEFMAITKKHGEDWNISDIMEYISEIENSLKNSLKNDNIKLDNVGIIWLFHEDI